MRTRLILVSTKPTPHARHVVCEPNRIRLTASPVALSDQGPAEPGPQQNENARTIREYAVTGKHNIKLATIAPLAKLATIAKTPTPLLAATLPVPFAF